MLGLTQKEFAGRYHIPIGTLRDWEQGRSEPDQPARAYLAVIAHDPRALRDARGTSYGLRGRPAPPATWQIPVTSNGEAIGGSSSARRLTVAAGLTDADIDRLIKRTQKEVEPNLAEAICRRFAPLESILNHIPDADRRGTLLRFMIVLDSNIISEAMRPDIERPEAVEGILP